MTDGLPGDPHLAIRTVRPRTGTIHIQVAGEIDLATAAQLRSALLAVIEDAPPATQIQVDLAQVSFLDATGVGVLIKSRDAAERGRIGFTVRNPDGIVRRVFDVLRLSHLLSGAPVGTVPGASPPDFASPATP